MFLILILGGGNKMVHFLNMGKLKVEMVLITLSSCTLLSRNNLANASKCLMRSHVNGIQFFLISLLKVVVM